MTIDTLRHVPLFESLDDETARKLCQLLESIDCKAKTSLFRAGDEGDAMYLIERGKVRICVQGTDGRDMTLTELGRGDFFARWRYSTDNGAPRMRSSRKMPGWLYFRASIFFRSCAAARMSRWNCSLHSPTD